MKRKVLIIMESMQGGGAEKVLLDLLGSIDSSRYDLELLIVFKVGTLLEKLPKDVPVRFLYPGKPKGVRRVIEHFVTGRDLLYRRDVRKLIGDDRWDTIVSFMEGPSLKIHNAIKDRAKRNVTWVHINLAVTHWTKYLYKNDRDEAEDYRDMDGIAFVSSGALKSFSDYFNLKGPHLQVINNIIPVEDIRRKAQSDSIVKKTVTLCSVGRLVEQKRFDRLLETCAILARENINFELWILGTGKEEQKLKEMARNLHIDKFVRFLGFQPNPYPYMKEADIFVLSSDTEGYPTVVCEALSLGKPIVSTSITGAEELLEGGAGILTSLTPQGLAEGIISLIKSPEKRKALEERALLASRNFDKAKVLQKVYKIIEGEYPDIND